MPRLPTVANTATGPVQVQANALLLPGERPAPRARWRRFGSTLLVLALIWGGLTGFRVDALVFGVPAVLAGASLVFLMPLSPGWRLSPGGALAFALWFVRLSVRGAVDVASRVFSPRMGLRPGFRSYVLSLPAGAPRVMFLNTVTLLPGTLAAEIDGDRVSVHMLDTSADLQADLGALEQRIAALFALI